MFSINRQILGGQRETPWELSITLSLVGRKVHSEVAL